VDDSKDLGRVACAFMRRWLVASFLLGALLDVLNMLLELVEDPVLFLKLWLVFVSLPSFFHSFVELFHVKNVLKFAFEERFVDCLKSLGYVILAGLVAIELSRVADQVEVIQLTKEELIFHIHLSFLLSFSNLLELHRRLLKSRLLESEVFSADLHFSFDMPVLFQLGFVIQGSVCNHLSVIKDDGIKELLLETVLVAFLGQEAGVCKLRQGGVLCLLRNVLRAVSFSLQLLPLRHHVLV
jgi:hypothetical protein